MNRPEERSHVAPADVPKASSARIVLIDALRGVAAAIVAFHHVFTIYPDVSARLHASSPNVYAIANWVSELNSQAVTLFFVLSGFSIALAVASHGVEDRASLQRYAYRRARRILPLYWLTLALSALLAWRWYEADPAALSGTTLLGNLLFLQSSKFVDGVWFPPFADNGPLWSLAPEVFYYVIFPFTLRASSRPGVHIGIAAAVTLAGFVVNQVFRNPIALYASSYLVWYAGVELARQHLGRPAALRLWGWTAIVCALELLVRLKPSATLQGIAFGLEVYLAGALLIRFRARIAERWQARARVLMAPLAWLGGISYALYLLHYPLLRVAEHQLPHTAIFMGLAAAFCVLVAFLAERWAATDVFGAVRRVFGAALPERRTS